MVAEDQAENLLLLKERKMLQLNNCTRRGLSVRTGLLGDAVSVVTFQGHPLAASVALLSPASTPRDGEVPGAGPAGPEAAVPSCVPPAACPLLGGTAGPAGTRALRSVCLHPVRVHPRSLCCLVLGLES